MKFCISRKINYFNSFFFKEYKGYYIYTDVDLSINEILIFFENYGFSFEATTLIYKSNELNSNFIYYDLHEKISNSLNFFDSKVYGIDNTGVIQRLTGPDYCNFGSRTIYKNIHKSIPSKVYIFSESNIRIADSNERLLYNNEKLTSNHIHEIENEILTFHEILFQKFDKIHMAMSGGLDSRLSFFAIEKAKLKLGKKSDLSMICYGSKKSWDYRIANLVAGKNQLKLKLYSDYTRVWPNIKEYDRYLASANGIGISNWNMICSCAQFEKNECLLLGDLYEIIVGRKLEISLTRKEKVSFKKTRKKKTEFINNPKLYIVNNVMKGLKNKDLFKEHYINNYSTDFCWSQVIDETEKDINQWLENINDKLLPAQIYEYFTLLCYTCPEYRNQIHTIRAFVDAHSISENIKLINKIVSINPEERKDNKLFNKLFLNSMSWKKLLKIPQASAPYLPASYNQRTIVNIQKLIRHLFDKLTYLLERRYPDIIRSRWETWRSAYKYGKNRDLYGKFGQDVEKSIDSKSIVGSSNPIPNFSFVNFESLMLSILEK
jgi:hypothetical protein